MRYAIGKAVEGFTPNDLYRLIGSKAAQESARRSST
jgi:hypothetical protein